MEEPHIESLLQQAPDTGLAAALGTNAYHEHGAALADRGGQSGR
jgi:hypothetical protein